MSDTPAPKILVPTDFSDHADHALAYAASLGEQVVVRLGAGGEGGGENCQNGVTGARHVGYLVGAVDRDVQRLAVGFDQGHAAVAAGREHESCFEICSQLLGGRRDIGQKGPARCSTRPADR